jgi:hypothetical protein
MKLSVHVLDMARSRNGGDDGCASSGECNGFHIDRFPLLTVCGVLRE